MRFFNDMRIGRRLGLAFALSIMFSVLLVGYARVRLHQINAALELMVEDRMVKVQQLEETKDRLRDLVDMEELSATVKRVDAGNQLVGQAGRTVDDVVTQVRRVADLISEISAASGERSKGLGQIGEAVDQLDQVTQQNAALVEGRAAAAESLQHQARQLAETVAAFKLDVPLS